MPGISASRRQGHDPFSRRSFVSNGDLFNFRPHIFACDPFQSCPKPRAMLAFMIKNSEDASRESGGGAYVRGNDEPIRLEQCGK